MVDQVLMPNQTTHGHPRNGFFFIVVLTPSCCVKSVQVNFVVSKYSSNLLLLLIFYEIYLNSL